MVNLEFNNGCATHIAVDIFKRYKEAFGTVIRAEMNSEPENIQYEFILTNSKGEKLIFSGECSAGYYGEGPNGTLKILKEAGFNVEDSFVYNNSNFALQK